MIKKYVCLKNFNILTKVRMRNGFQVKHSDIIEFNEDDLSYFVFNGLKYEIACGISKDDFSCMLKDGLLIQFTEEDDKWYKIRDGVNKLVEDCKDILKELDKLREGGKK